MASHVVGLIGRKQSGKDTFAARLVSEHGFTRIAFADALKAVALDLNPMIAPYSSRLRDALDRMGGWDGAKQLPEVRSLLQNLGVAVRDNIHRDAWIDAVAHKVRAVPGPVVVTDVRFVNEVDYIAYAGGTTVRIARAGQDDRDTHVSETALDGYKADHYVYNGSTVDSLWATADAFAASVLVAARANR